MRNTQKCNIIAYSISHVLYWNNYSIIGYNVNKHSCTQGNFYSKYDINLDNPSQIIVERTRTIFQTYYQSNENEWR